MNSKSACCKMWKKEKGSKLFKKKEGKKLI